MEVIEDYEEKVAGLAETGDGSGDSTKNSGTFQSRAD